MGRRKSLDSILKSYKNRCKYLGISGSSRRPCSCCEKPNSGVYWTSSDRCLRHFKSNSPHPNCPFKTFDTNNKIKREEDG